jgi:hypothetical protein
MTNGLVEIGLVSVSIVLGILALPAWVIGAMVGMSLAWWGFVHHARFGAMLKAGPAGALGTLLLTLVVMGIGHAIGYGFGRALHAVLG